MKEKIASLRALVIAAEANSLVVDRLVAGASNALADRGLKQDQQKIVRVAGALEIPLMLKRAASSKRFDVFVVLGAVIKGQTDHYEHVASMANNGVLNVALEYGLALGNGILTVHSMEQALARADGTHGNIGRDAALAALNLKLSYLSLELAGDYDRA